MLPIIKTDFLLLRPLTLSDVPAVFSYASAPAATQFIHWQPHKTPADTINFIKKALATQQPIWGITTQDNDTLVGECGFHIHANTVEIHCTLIPTHWGQGIAYEALQALVTRSFDLFTIETIQASIISSNQRSLQLARKLGMVHTATLEHQWFYKGMLYDVLIFTLSKHMRAAPLGYSPHPYSLQL